MKMECRERWWGRGHQGEKRISIPRSLFVVIFFLTLISNALAQDDGPKLERIKTQIHILNLLNGLELDSQQMQLILAAANEAQEVLLKTREVLVQKGEITQAYQEVLKVAQTGSLVIPQDAASRVHKVNREVDRLKKVDHERMASLTLRIKNSLKAYQIYALNDYKACIIPPLKKGRIGQSEDAEGFSKVLERVHHMSPKQYEQRKEEIAKQAIDRAKTKEPPGYILDQDGLKKQILKAMDDVRAMPDVDFALKKEEIAKSIQSQLLPQRLPVNIGVKIERFLLHPEIIPILEERLKRGQS